MSEGSQLSPSEREELARLRRAAADAQAGGGGAARGLRWTAAVVLLVVSAMLGAVSVVAGYVRGQLLNTDRYVETVAPLVRDPAVQDAIAARLTDVIVTELNLTRLTQQLADALEQRGAPNQLDGLVGPAVNGLTSFIHDQVRTVVASEQFAEVWGTANRVAHREIDAVLTTGKGQLLTSQGTEVSLDLGSLLDLVKQRLVANGFSLAARIPDISVTVPLFASEELPRIRTAVSILDTAAWLLPLITLALLLAGVLVAPNRRRGLLIGSALLAGAMLLLIGGLGLLRTFYLNNLPDSVQSPEAARVLYDTETRFLIDAVQTLLALFLVVAIACWLAGPSRPAVLLRQGLGRALDAAGGELARTGLPLGPAPAIARRHRRVIGIGLALLGVLILVLWRYPGVGGVLWVAVGVLVLVGVVEVIARAETAGTTMPARAAGAVG
jgi:hypothetical protein